MEFIGFVACMLLIVGAIIGTIALVSSVFEAWGQIRNLRKDHDERASRVNRLALDLSLAIDRLDTHNAFILDIGERLAALEAPTGKSKDR